AAIRTSPSAIQRSDTICGAARTVSLPTGRDSLPAQKRSDKHSSSRGGSFRLLQPILLGPKKGRELSANIRSTCIEQSTHAAEVQNAELKRCVLPCRDPPQTSKLSEICVRRNSIPVPRTPVRLGFGTEGFYKVRGSSHRPITTTRIAFIQLFGRLVDLCSFKSSSGARLPSSGGTLVPTRLRDKQGKKRSVPKPDYAFPRHGSRLHLHGGQAVSRTNKCHQNMCAPVPTGTVSLVAVLPVLPVRNDGVSRY